MQPTAPPEAEHGDIHLPCGTCVSDVGCTAGEYRSRRDTARLCLLFLHLHLQQCLLTRFSLLAFIKAESICTGVQST